MAWYIEQRIACEICGTKPDDWDPKQGGHRQAFTAKSWTCHGCRLTQEVYSSASKENPDLHGLKVRLEPTVHHPSYRPSMGNTGG